jgi:hypothetical protein
MTTFWFAQGPVLLNARGPVIATRSDIAAAERADAEDSDAEHAVVEDGDGERAVGEEDEEAAAAGVDAAEAGAAAGSEGCSCCVDASGELLSLRSMHETLLLPLAPDAHTTNANAALLARLQARPDARAQLTNLSQRCQRVLMFPAVRQWTSMVHRLELDTRSTLITPMEMVELVSRWDHSEVIRMLQLVLLHPDLRAVQTEVETQTHAAAVAPWDADVCAMEANK